MTHKIMWTEGQKSVLKYLIEEYSINRGSISWTAMSKDNAIKKLPTVVISEIKEFYYKSIATKGALREEILFQKNKRKALSKKGSEPLRIYKKYRKRRMPVSPQIEQRLKSEGIKNISFRRFFEEEQEITLKTVLGERDLRVKWTRKTRAILRYLIWIFRDEQGRIRWEQLLTHPLSSQLPNHDYQKLANYNNNILNGITYKKVRDVVEEWRSKKINESRTGHQIFYKS